MRWTGLCFCFLSLSLSLFEQKNNKNRHIKKEQITKHAATTNKTNKKFKKDIKTPDRLRVVTLRFGVAYLQLRECARVKGWMLWPVTPKVHRMQHVPLYASVTNPRFVQNYAEESLIGTCTQIWHRSVAGRYRSVAQKNVLTKKLLGLLLHFETP